jgi:hypothetical protein
MGEHKDECKALQAYKKAGAASDDARYGFCAVPELPIRALARLLWRRPLHDEAWVRLCCDIWRLTTDPSHSGPRSPRYKAVRSKLVIGATVLRAGQTGRR